jgi:hypothetical protein
MKDPHNPQINASKIPVAGNVAGAIFALGVIAICVTAFPALWYIGPAAILVGCGVALLLRFSHRKTPGAPWLLPQEKNTPPTPDLPAERSPEEPKNFRSGAGPWPAAASQAAS